MKPEEILDELKELSKKDNITRDELMIILKKYAAEISVHDLMMATARMRKDGKFVHANYREKYLKIYIKYFILRMKEVLNNDSYDNEIIDKKSFDSSFPYAEKDI